ARFSRRGTRQRRNHDCTGFGLPPCVDNRATTFAYELAIPHPRFGVDRFADRSQQAQTGKIMFQRPLLSPFYESANRCWCGVKDIYFMSLDDAPKTVGLRKVWGAFVHQDGRAI